MLRAIRICVCLLLVFCLRSYGIQPVGDSIYSIEKITLGDLPQHVIIKGSNINDPVLLILHGGPGFPESYLFRNYNSELEKHFVVVYWDQRGAGLSYKPGIPDSTMTIPRFISDAHELVTTLKKRFHKDKIYLLGHSWGSVLGVLVVQKYPEDFYAYAGVGQGVDMETGELESYRYALRKAEEDKNTKAITELKAIEDQYQPGHPHSVDGLRMQRGWLMHYGGVVYGEQGFGKFFKNLTVPEKDLYNFDQNDEGEEFSLRTLWNQFLKVNLIKSAPELKVPVYFFLGRHDYNTPFFIAEKYFKLLKAPHKELFWFEKSGHTVPFEEPEKFDQLVISRVLQHKAGK
ncbi:MAG TPA: alpha/beta hydrolase [Chitinophaga sp.]|uniref:alpha/beta fold hydrolase n=1 Tax=Chitinophaga sp. TaxID=1869181 RepID=UPI002C386276|nr:alpha/beta hydrolase [Chitinophaga sp.]HVI45313.1 alpha/beta hydrolase [Chitinophaga sp.]